MDFHYNRWHLFCQSVFLFLSPLFIKNPPPPIPGDGGSCFFIIIGTFLRIRLQFLECFTLPRPLISLGCAEPASPKGSFCTVLSGIGFIETPQGSSQYLPQRGRGTARRRWMRGGTALCVIGTTGAKVNLPSLTVGNGLCAVPLRCNYNPCGQTGTTPDMSFRDRSESRNLPKLHVLPCVGTFLPRGGFLHSACATVGMTKLGYVSTDSPIVSGLFHVAPLPHQSRLRRASFPGGEAFVPCFQVSVLSKRPREALNTFPNGEGGPPAGGG